MDKISVIDLLSDVSNIDYKKEFAKLKDMLLERKVYGNAEEMYTIESFFNKYISEWRYRGTAVNLKEIYEKIGLLYSLSYIKNEETIIINLLTLIDLILNIELFCNDIIKKLNEKRYEYEEFLLLDNKVYENCRVLLKYLNYKIYNDEDRVYLIKNETDTIVTIEELKDKDISKLLLSYIDFRNKNNLSAKKRILNDIANYLEPLRNNIPNEDLKNTLFKLFNSINIRHNNKTGTKKKEPASNFTKEE